MEFLVVGLGSMGKRRVRNLQTLDAERVVGFDLREDRRSEAADRYGIEVFGTMEEALASDPDAVIISLPPDLHVPFATRAIEAGKPFFTEASVTIDGVREMIALMRSRGVIGFPSCTMRFFPGPKQVTHAVREGMIGEPMFWSYHSGQYLHDWHPWESIQDFYVSKRETGGCREIVPFELVWLTKVFGSIQCLSAEVGKVSDLPCDIDDIYQVLTRHEQGVRGSLTVDVVSRPAVRDFRAVGTDGTVEWDNASQTVRLFQADQAEWREVTVGTEFEEEHRRTPEAPYVDEMRSFIACVEQGSEPDYTFADDLEILERLVAAEESSRTGTRMCFGDRDGSAG